MLYIVRGGGLKINIRLFFIFYQQHYLNIVEEKFKDKKRRNATKPGFQRFNQVLI